MKKTIKDLLFRHRQQEPLSQANCCLHVGDDPIADVQGAKNVGMKTAFIKRTNLEANADISIERLDQLLELLNKK